MPKSILDILVSKGIIKSTRVEEFKKKSKEDHISLEEFLSHSGVLETDIATAKGELYGYPTMFLQGTPPPIETLKDIPEESARHYKIIPLGIKEGYFQVGMLNPRDGAAQAAIKFLAARKNLPLRIFVVIPSDVDSVLAQYQNLSQEVTKVLGEFEEESKTSEEEVKINKQEPTKIIEDAPITKMVAVILRHAVEGRASDIHIEPLKDNVRVRFRLDGVLHTSLLLPPDVHSSIVTRIKVITNLKIDETRIPQDGRFRAEINKREIDFRVSTFPTALGEKVAIRILDPEAGIGSMEELGITGKNLQLLEKAIQKPFGLILITGPTGSGKSTTLYTILQKINKEGINIVSLEDPVEYYIKGVNQSQIHPEIGYDFATGLRHILRQDPDVILVGEIRDKETAALAIHAALTGHLVFSTLHTNNAIGVIPRLIDMGVDPYLIPPTLILAVAQRLIRKLCPESTKKVKIAGRIKDVILQEVESMPSALKEETKKMMPLEVKQPESSSLCPTGTKGRIGIFETLLMTPELEKIILTGPSEARILEEAKRQEMITIKQDGIIKVLKGIIGLEDLLEVV